LNGENSLKLRKRLGQATPLGFLTHAQEFLAAGELVLNHATAVSLPAYFLLGRSIELSLKAFLLARGVEKLDSQEAAIIKLLSYDYAEKSFEYRVTRGVYSLPMINVTEGVAKRLAYELKPFCSNASNH
jgi:hypothetical protein